MTIDKNIEKHKALHAEYAELMSAPSQEQFCFCGNEISLQIVSGGAVPEGLYGRVTLKVNDDYVDYVKSAPSQEPVAWVAWHEGKFKWPELKQDRQSNIPLYTHPSDAAAQIAKLDKNWGEVCDDYLKRIANLEAENSVLRKPWKEKAELREQIAQQRQVMQMALDSLMVCDCKKKTEAITALRDALGEGK